MQLYYSFSYVRISPIDIRTTPIILPNPRMEHIRGLFSAPLTRDRLRQQDSMMDPARIPISNERACPNCTAVKNAYEGLYRIIIRETTRGRNASVTVTTVPSYYDDAERMHDNTMLFTIIDHDAAHSISWQVTAEHSEEPRCNCATIEVVAKHAMDLPLNIGLTLERTLRELWAHCQNYRTEATAYLLATTNYEQRQAQTCLFVIFGVRPIATGGYRIAARM